MKKHFTLFATLVIFCASFAQAVTFTWNGNAGDGKWKNKNNWNPVQVPNVGDDAIIAASLTYPTISGVSGVGSLTINPSATLTIGAGGKLTTTTVDVNGTLTLNGSLICSILNNPNYGVVASAGSNIELTAPQDINKGITYGNLLLNAPYDTWTNWFKSTGDIYVYGTLQIGNDNDYLTYTYGTGLSLNSNNVFCNNFTDNGIVYDADAAAFHNPPGSIILTNLSANTSRVKGYSPLLYSSSAIMGTQMEYTNLGFWNTSQRVDVPLYMDAVVNGVSVMDCSSGSTVFYSDLYFYGNAITSTGPGTFNQVVGGTNTAYVSNMDKLNLGSVNNLYIYNSYYKSQFYNGLVRGYLYTASDVVNAGVLKIGVANSSVASVEGSFDMPNGAGLIINGDINAPVSTISGNWQNVSLKKAGTTKLGGSTQLYGTLSLLSGNCDLNGNVLGLVAGSSILEPSGNVFIDGTNGVGVIQTWIVPGGAVSKVNPCNIGISLSTDADPGNLNIVRRVMSTTASGNTSVNRRYDIFTSNNVNLTYVKLFYDDSEMNGNAETSNAFNVKSSTDAVNWNDHGSTRSPSANWVWANVLLPTSSMNYFTLSDQSSFLKPVHAKTKTTFESGIFPNPFSEQFNVQIKSDVEEITTVQLVDMSGKCVFKTTRTVTEGNNQWNFSELDNLSPGTYVFTITGNQTMVQQKLIKY